MIIGLSVAAFTELHVVISLIGIATGIVFVAGMLAGRWLDGWNVAFLVTTILTSVTGFMFHSKAFGPPHIVGVISLVTLAIALFALYARGRTGLWRVVYIVAAVLALWLNAFVGVVQTFQKIGFFNRFAPTGSEPPFLVAHAAVLVFFGLLGWQAVRRTMPTMKTAA
jgi:hypothetical protein